MFFGEILPEELSNKPKSCGTNLSCIKAWPRVNQNPPIMHYEGWMESEQGTVTPSTYPVVTYLPTYRPI
jgi:hypothetical protein